jgi:hypothetical protein
MYRYSDIVENQRVISYQIKNSQVVTNVQHLNFIPNIGKIFVIFIELYKKWTFVHIKGKKLLHKPGKKKATLESSQKCVNGLLRNLSDM